MERTMESSDACKSFPNKIDVFQRNAFLDNNLCVGEQDQMLHILLDGVVKK